MSLSGLQINEGEGPQAGIGDLKALPLGGLHPTGVTAPLSLCRWSPLPQLFPQGPVLLGQNSCNWLGRWLDTQVRVLWPYWHPPSMRNVDSQQAQLCQSLVGSPGQTPEYGTSLAQRGLQTPLQIRANLKCDFLLESSMKHITNQYPTKRHFS